MTTSLLPTRLTGIFVAFAAIMIGGGSIYANEITSASDPALAGATTETFNATPTGAYFGTPPLALTGFTAQADGGGGFYIIKRGTNVIEDYFSTLNISFDAPVNAFGFDLSGVHNQQSLSIFDGTGGLIATVAIAPGTSYYGYASDSADIGSFALSALGEDYWDLDNLAYTSTRQSETSVPDSGNTAVLLGSVVLFIGAMRRRVAIS